MNPTMYGLMVTNVPRFVLVLVYLGIGLTAVLRREQLGTATAWAVVGAGALAVANVIGLGAYFWQVSASLSGRTALSQIASTLTLAAYVTQSLSVIGAACIGLAVFSGRPLGPANEVL